MTYLPNWSDAAIMTCDLSRLRTAIDTARANADEERRFQLRLNGFTVPDPIPDDQTDDEMNESAVNLMAMLRGRAALSDEDDD